MDHRKRILIADDDEEDFILLKESLLKVCQDADVRRECNGHELLSSLALGSYPNLILMDLNMPLLNGCETLLEIRKSALFGHIPVVMLTTSSAEHDIVRCYQLGVNAYMKKPVRLDEFETFATMVNSYWLRTASLP
jgi:two-component system, response regulator